MVMTDARFQRMTLEYEALRSTQDKIVDGLDRVLPNMITAIEQNRAAIEQNRVAIEQNRAAIEQNRVAIEQNRVAIERNRLAIAEANHKLDALIKHWDVAYEKPPMGFNPER